MLTVKEANMQQIKSKIEELLDTGVYKDLDALLKVNPTLDIFIFNTKMNYLSYSFATQFTNEDYLNLIAQLKKEANHPINKNDIKQTVIDNNVFLGDGDNEKTLVGIDKIEENTNMENTFEEEAKFEKREAHFENLNNIDINDLSEEEMKIYQTVIQENDAENYKIYIDENGKLTNTVVYNNEDYFKIEDVNGKLEFNKQTSEILSQENISKQKVYTLNNKKTTGNAAFANILILSFIIGSFFGIIFLAIYQQVMS